MRVVTATVAAALVVALAGVTVRGQESLRDVVDRAAAYVADYKQKLAMVVAQERYQQEVRYPAPPMSRSRDITSTTVLLSDFLLVRDAAGTWVPFRDVFERDGVAVRDREDRLSALFIQNAGTALDQAARIAEESARYNVGNINRNVNVPTLALEFLTDSHRDRFDFEFEKGLSSGGVRVVRYQERSGPTYIKTTNNRDLPVSGRYWIHEATGRVERSEVRAADAALDAHITVTYRADEAGFWVPDRMEEVYAQKNDRSEIRGTAVYSRYRRFQVTTSDELVK
ncbi:MAG: hypothetical protein ABL986_08565 [Vicinamibacterales bacterium]